MTNDSRPRNQHSGKATSQTANIEGSDDIGLQDRDWKNKQWQSLIERLIREELVSWKEVGALTLGHLNPSQVGTSLASSQGFKDRYNKDGKRESMQIVMDWFYKQIGKCKTCGTRLELQADHITPREDYIRTGNDPMDADTIENITLRCRRHNVTRRPSHQWGGQTHLTAEAALMWILFAIKPRTRIDFTRLCRIYGMTMADIRMNEAWAMAHWLSRDNNKYHIENDKNSYYDILRWCNGAVTRTDTGEKVPEAATLIHEKVKGDHQFAFLTSELDKQRKIFVYPLCFIPFSTYNLGSRPSYALAIRYAKVGNPPEPKIFDLSPVNSEIISSVVIGPQKKLMLEYRMEKLGVRQMEPSLPKSVKGKIRGKKLSANLQKCELKLVVG